MSKQKLLEWLDKRILACEADLKVKDHLSIYIRGQAEAYDTVRAMIETGNFLDSDHSRCPCTYTYKPMHL